jgi:outer membrane protein assembly factor BamE
MLTTRFFSYPATPSSSSGITVKLARALFAAVLLASLSACIYKQTIAQGNILKQEDIDTLKPGMTKKQVSLILGTPALQSAFTQDRWDYVYSYDDRKNPAQRKAVSLMFVDGALASIDGDFKPGGDVSVYKPEDVIIEATKEYRKALRDAEKGRANAEDETVEKAE